MTLSHYFFGTFASLLLLASVHEATAEEPDCAPTTASEIASLIEQAKKKIIFVKYEGAMEKLDTAKSSLMCLKEPLGRLDLGRLYVYRGVALFFMEQKLDAKAAFEQALVIDRKVQWDEQFGDLPKGLFLEAKENVLEYPRGSIRIPMDLKPGSVLYVDGDPHEAGDVIENVTSGYHFVQAMIDDIVVQSTKFNVMADTELTITVPPELLEVKEPFDAQKLRPASYAAFGVGGLALVGGAGAGVVTLLTQKNLKDNYYQNRPDDEKDTLLDRQKTTAYLADGCFAAAVVFGGVGTVLYFVSQPKEPADLYSQHFYSWASRDGAGVGFRGRF